MKRTRVLKIDELCRRSGFKKSTIYYYLRVGLLHKLREKGHRIYLYDEAHLAKLNVISQLRQEKNLTLSAIREFLENNEVSFGSGLRGSIPPFLTQKAKGRLKPAADQKTEKKRERILSKALELFTTKGFTRTKISDITDDLQIGKGSFYLYFKNKEDLFRACMGLVASRIQPPDSVDCITDGENFEQTLYRRTHAFCKTFHELSGIFMVLRRALKLEDPKNFTLAKNYICKLIRPLIKDIEKAKADGIVRNTDARSVAHVVLALAETIGYRLMFDPTLRFEESLETYMDIIKHGILNPRNGIQL